MIRMQFVNGSPYRVALPNQREKQDVLALAQAFIRYENEQPVTEHTPLTGAIEATLAQALTVQAESYAAEAERKAASEALKRLNVTALMAVRQIRLLLAGTFAQTPERAQAWGFVVRQTGRSAGYILMPNNEEEIRVCLTQYIQMEQSRATAEQFTIPALADMVALRDGIQQQRQARYRAEQNRLQANAAVEESCKQLSDYLRRALNYLVTVRFDGQGDRLLGLWGFKVVTRTPGGPAAPESHPETDPTPETMPEPV